ncbi:restriction endonuclease subunit S [Psychrobacter sp. UBA2514]|jgi:type I restriction enzyme S subunit|uniref:restriction endonuclease subunit S n=1 Tax=Psychrobacter sp. UBA2514 TaxID=1947346 RepID=UPI00257AA042|nr:restriction endonuclease subunit S [Psychrobacter sp. UBA2514]|tara:strand:+ start:3260 stop:4546 length:1287 start_codon:yes stop_codon:yes gene_type:complete
MSEVKIPEGYKQTEVGVIPEDWEVTTIGDFSPLQRGFDLPTTQVEAGEYPVVYSNGILRTHKAFQVNGAGIVTGRSGTIGKVHYVERDFWPHNTTLWVTSFGNSNVKFVYYLFNSIGFERFKSGSGVPTLNRNDAHSFKIVVPSEVKEQIAIATALSDVDDLIKSLEKLITKKEAIKTATMQQLLTGKTRLPEFATREDGSAKGFKQTELGQIPEDWEVRKLNQISDVKSGGTPSTSDSSYWNGSILWCTPTDITALKSQKYLSNTLKKITKAGLENSSAELLPIGSIVMTSRATIGECAITTKNISTNQGFKNFICFDNTNNEFLYYNLSNSKNRLVQLCSGSTFLEISTTQTRNFEISVPSIQEQTAIATILSDMDTEIQALQQRLDKTRDIKQGMMQQLLTGKVRLVSSDSSSTYPSADNGDCLA